MGSRDYNVMTSVTGFWNEALSNKHDFQRTGLFPKNGRNFMWIVDEVEIENVWHLTQFPES